MFDLDVQVLKAASGEQPDIKSKLFCTPGCVDQTTKTSCCLKCKTSLCNSNMSCW
ncbi:gallidermin family lantibiotic [Cytobacillus firmus]|nr:MULTISPECIES: gallidermin family lantibiotic [Bacillales]MDD9313703.1 gallidermin family lantibiotic [Cytobacillus firmus]MED1941178.1 gallidermin family lantibiotic [Cytobacillus firmus]